MKVPFNIGDLSTDWKVQPVNQSWHVYISNSLHFCAKICWDIRPWTLSVPRNERISESVARGELWAMRNRLCPRKNIRAYFCPKWRKLYLLSFKSFWKCMQFWKLGNILGFPQFYPRNVQPGDMFKRKYLMDHNQK